MRVEVDGTELGTVAVRGGAARAVEHVFSTDLGAGEHVFRFIPINYINEPASGYGNNVNVEAVELRGPLAEAPGRALVYVCDPAPPPAPATVDVRRHVPDPTAFAAWRFRGEDIAHVADADVWAEGPALVARPRLVQTPGDPAVYIIDVDADGVEIKRHVQNPQSMADWRFAFADVEPLSAAERDALPSGPAWPQGPHLVQGATPHVYTLDVSAQRPDASAYDLACYRTIVTTFARRAWRRPLDEAESDALATLFIELVGGGESGDDALRLVLRQNLDLARLHLPGLHARRRLLAREPPVLLPVEQHAGRRAARGRGARGASK